MITHWDGKYLWCGCNLHINEKSVKKQVKEIEVLTYPISNNLIQCNIVKFNKGKIESINKI